MMFYHVYVMSTDNQNCRFIIYDYLKNNTFYSRSQMTYFYWEYLIKYNL